MDSYLVNSEWIAGNNITIADFSILGTVTTADVSSIKLLHNFLTNLIYFQHFGYNIGQHSSLNKWYQKCKSLPGFDENEAGAKYLASVVKKLTGGPIFVKSNI